MTTLSSVSPYLDFRTATLLRFLAGTFPLSDICRVVRPLQMDRRCGERGSEMAEVPMNFPELVVTIQRTYR